jgi:hypothetical protein
MQRRSANVVWHRDTIGDILDAIATAAPLAEILDGAELRLFQNAFVPNPDMVPTDFTDATFVGYALHTPVVWSAVGNVDPYGRAVHGEGNFVAGAIVAAQLIYGYVLTTAAKAAVLCAEQFVTPVNFVNPGDFLELDVYLQLAYNWAVNQV